MAALPKGFRKLVATRLTPQFRDAVETQVSGAPSALKPTEVFVKNIFVGINASDVNFTAGKYKPDARVPFDCGFEALGEVIAVGENAKGFNIGDAVVTRCYGAFSEYQTVPSRQMKKVPSLKKEWLPLDLSGLTASISLEEVVKPLPGEVAVVSAAAGGTGQFAVQLLKNIYRCRVIGITSSLSKESFLKKLGCDNVIIEETESVHEGLRKFAPTGVNLAYESVGGETFDAIVNNISLRGRILSIGSISGYNDGSSWMHHYSNHAPIQTRLLSKSATLHTFFLPHFAKYDNRHFSKLCHLCETAQIRSFVDLFPSKGLEAIPDAVSYMYQRKNIGKIVVEL